jgi:site-specific recombinase XerD
MAMRMRGMGSVFQKRYRDRTGRVLKTTNFYIQFAVNGRMKRETTEFTKKNDAINYLKQRLSDLQAGRVSIRADVTFDDLAKLIITDYKNNGRKNLYNLEVSIIPKLGLAFGGLKAMDIRTGQVEQYKTERLRAKAAPATLNRELAALKRMFRLGIQQEIIVAMPHVALLAEHNVRKGFLEREQFNTILAHVPEKYHALFEAAFITGWRMESELLTREWANVQFSSSGCLRIEPGEAKDWTQGREFPFTAWLRTVLERQRGRVEEIQRTTGRIIPLVFCHDDGRPLANFRIVWNDACEKAGIKRIPHDFRRTAVRNAELAGVPRSTAMAMIGHKTESIYKRYSIQDGVTLAAGAAKLDSLHQSQELQAKEKVVGFGQQTAK